MPLESKGALSIETSYRSPLEEKVAEQLQAAGVAFQYESMWMKCVKPATVERYKPDFVTGPIIIEAKGRFGFDKSDADGFKARDKLVRIKQQNPLYDIRIVFERASTKIRKGSKTTYAMWAEENGFKWSDKGRVPEEWLDEIRQHQQREKLVGDDSNCVGVQAVRSQGPISSRTVRKHQPKGRSTDLRAG